eukprot:gnl/TRDRNA2_/TRDRNA2_133520_c0_seq1.p1 gnl/TRDRNA2_/TRDRNA2_133520_c0~~gnl/TRDRNA2_/TRDRNA2_133520_c0_seq1.p1  ORF type:complete len:531 (-),score=132.12 gnl/TRDRNA2_/TRDRNA2_133520_c0_seq1:1-1593(-)
MAKNDDPLAQKEYIDYFLNEFVLFYSNKPYGPYKVCIEYKKPDDVWCQDLENSKWETPKRRSFQMDITKEESDTKVISSFDYGSPLRADANTSIVLISMVIFLMCGACLLLNYSASELAVRPLERMLSSIKKSAKSIFSSVSALGSDDDEDFGGEDMDGEVALLERVVRKIATLAELSTKKNPFDDASMSGMKSEELGVLALTASHVQPQAEKKDSDDSSPVQLQEVMDPSRMEVTVTMQWQLEEIGISFALLNSWDFNPIELDAVKQSQICTWLLMNNPGSSSYAESNVDMKRMRTFVEAAMAGYPDNIFHNWTHAVDVTHAIFRYCTLGQMELLFTAQEEFALLVAGTCHDLGHIGFNNSFLTESQHELAIRYNDRSPLENMHCCKLFELIAKPETNVFHKVSKDQFREVRKLMIDVVLHTDICQHPAMVKELELVYEMNSKVFDANQSGPLCEPEVEILSQGENKKLCGKLLVHAADTSNPTKPWEICQAWAFKVLDEYFAQGDLEKKRGLPVQMLNDRDKVCSHAV